MTNDQIQTEANRIARNAVKTELKRHGVKISDVEASEITKASKHLLKAEPGILKEARRNLKRLYDLKRRNSKRWLEKLP